MRTKIFIWMIFIVLLTLPVYSHGGEDQADHHMDDESSMGFMHYGSLSFPA